MKIKYLLVLLLFPLHFMNSQNYEMIDDKIKKYPDFPDIETLATRINNDFEDENDKVRAIYTWLATKIDYDLSTYYIGRKDHVYEIRSLSDFKNQKEKRHANLVKNSFKTKKALCQEYSLMFEYLCKLSGIKSKVIKGITKISIEDINNIRNTKDHAWNAVLLNNKWHLLDITWSTGYENRETKTWEKKFNDYFFLVAPNELITSHFPVEKKWQLIDKKISLINFFSKPIFYTNYFKSNLFVSPELSGTLKINENNNKIQIQFTTKEKRPELYYAFFNYKFIKHLRLKKIDNTRYLASITYKEKTANNTLTIYLKNKPILDFKIVSDLGGN